MSQGLPGEVVRWTRVRTRYGLQGVDGQTPSWRMTSSGSGVYWVVAVSEVHGQTTRTRRHRARFTVGGCWKDPWPVDVTTVLRSIERPHFPYTTLGFRCYLAYRK